MTFIPWDFIIDKNNLSDTELDLRYGYGSSTFFNKENANAAPAPVAPAPVAASEAAPAITAAEIAVAKLRPIEEFKVRYQNLRNFIADLAVARLKEVFRVRAKEVCGQKRPHCESLEDYLLEYRTASYGNDLRKMVDDLCNQMWGKECFGQLEIQVMNKLKLKYVNCLVNPENKVKNRRCYGTIKQMINRLRQTLIIERFR